MASKRDVQNFAEDLQYIFDLGDFEITQRGGGEYEILFIDGFEQTRSIGFESELQYNSDNNRYGLEVIYHDEQGRDYYIAVK